MSITTNWFARDLKMRPGMMASLSGGLATMGPGVPCAITAKNAKADLDARDIVIASAKEWWASVFPARERP
ncbi:hypothetical protein [Aquabacterium sp.]|uniref:hypothetical protein n=1 Tax=Aquabacterium sp. TaxID=1872578 RepID=UPI003D6CA1B6